MKIPPSLYPLIALFVCLLAAPTPVTAVAEDWKPIDAAELSLKSPTVEKEADAEGLFWEVRIDDSRDGDLIFNHYLRVKVFTERGRESQSKVDIPFGNLYGGEVKIKDIAARTIKTDGSIVELKKEDIFERTIVKVSGLKVKARSFAMPAVEPGCIIEYRWREVRVKENAHYLRLQFQRDIPVRRVQYLIKPFVFGFVIVTIAYGTLEVYGGSRVGGWRAVAIGQAYVLVRLALRLLFAASELRLFNANQAAAAE